MKTLLLALLVLTTACTVTPQNPEGWMEREANACLPTAIAFRQGLERSGVWSEVFIYRHRGADGRDYGHAMAAYLYPPGANRLWTYDLHGSYLTRAYTNDVAGIARAAHTARTGLTNTWGATWVR